MVGPPYGQNRIARNQLNDDAEAVIAGMTDSELARLAANIDNALRNRRIERALRDLTNDHDWHDDLTVLDRRPRADQLFR
jgi:hypothetical protein